MSVREIQCGRDARSSGADCQISSDDQFHERGVGVGHPFRVAIKDGYAQHIFDVVPQQVCGDVDRSLGTRRDQEFGAAAGGGFPSAGLVSTI